MFIMEYHQLTQSTNVKLNINPLFHQQKVNQKHPKHLLNINPLLHQSTKPKSKTPTKHKSIITKGKCPSKILKSEKNIPQSPATEQEVYLKSHKKKIKIEIKSESIKLHEIDEQVLRLSEFLVEIPAANIS
eukprot:71076_1